MKTTTSASTRNPRLGLYVGLVLMLPGALGLEGAGLWLAYGQRPITLALVAIGSVACLVGAALVVASALREGAPALAPERAAALAHAQKMEALGLLAGGVAHDFNNLLHVIRNSLEIVMRQDPHTDTRRYLNMIRRSADRATTLTRQLLAFSRLQPPDPRPLDPNDLVAQVTELLRHSLGERVTIRTVLGPGVWNVAADAGQLETALINLAINARDAMPHAGLLTIETANAALEGPAVMIAVSDTGTGMAPEVAARACEPFFTTKEPGRGTGLGLSQVAGFARQSGGELQISTVPGQGTTVRLYLPKAGPIARTDTWRVNLRGEAAQTDRLAAGMSQER